MAGGVAARAAAAAQVFVADPGAPELDPDDRHHLSRVLRLAAGESVVAADGRGRWALCRFDGERLVPDGDPVDEPPPAPVLTVAFAPVKGERTEWAVQKLTELGVDRLVPLATDRGVVRWSGEREAKTRQRLDRVARAAAAQSRRVWLPELAPMRTLTELAEGSFGPVAMAEPGGAPVTPAHRVVAVGPEGGWSDGERALGLTRLSLGDGILRAETAAVAAGALLGALRAGALAPGGPG